MNRRDIPVVHPAAVAILTVKNAKNRHDHRKAREEVEALERKRPEIFRFVEESTGGRISADTLRKDFDTLDRLSSRRDEEEKPIRNEISRIRTLSVTKKEKEEMIAPLNAQIIAIRRDYSAQALIATSLASSKIYDEQSKIETKKSGRIGRKGKVAIVGALAAAGVGVYIVTQEPFRSSQDAINEVVNGMVAQQKVDANGATSYVDGIDQNSQAFGDMVSSSSYKSRVDAIISGAQSELDSISESTRSTIAKALDSINRLESESGYVEEVRTVQLNDYRRMMKGTYPNSTMLESYGTFLARIRADYAAQYEMVKGLDDELANKVIPEPVIQNFRDHGIEFTVQNLFDVESLISKSLTIKENMIDGTISFEIGAEIPEKYTKEFLLNHLNITWELGRQYDDGFDTVLHSDEHKICSSAEMAVDHMSEEIDEYLSKVNPAYSERIREQISIVSEANIDYVNEVERINSDAIEQIARIQQECLGLTGDLVSANLADNLALDVQATDDQSLIQGMINDALNSDSGIVDKIVDMLANMI